MVPTSVVELSRRRKPLAGSVTMVGFLSRWRRGVDRFAIWFRLKGLRVFIDTGCSSVRTTRPNSCTRVDAGKTKMLRVRVCHSKRCDERAPQHHISMALAAGYARRVLHVLMTGRNLLGSTSYAPSSAP